MVYATFPKSHYKDKIKNETIGFYVLFMFLLQKKL